MKKQAEINEMLEDYEKTEREPDIPVTKAEDGEKEKYYRYTMEQTTYIAAQSRKEADKKYETQDYVCQEDELKECKETNGIPVDFFIF